MDGQRAVEKTGLVGHIMCAWHEVKSANSLQKIYMLKGNAKWVKSAKHGRNTGQFLDNHAAARFGVNTGAWRNDRDSD